MAHAAELKYFFSVLNLNIRQKILFLFLGLLSITTILQGEFLVQGNNEIIVNKEFKIKLLEERLQAGDIFQGVLQARNTLEILRASPAVTGIVRASSNSDIDPFDNSSLDNLKHRLQTTFVNLLQFSPEVFQLRLIGTADSGREIVRVDRIGEDIVVIPEGRLQQKGHRDYFQEVIKLKNNQMYTSEINLNRENGVIQEPYIPTIRLATPIYRNDHSIFGMIVININFAEIINDIKERIKGVDKLYLVNSDGEYLFHPDNGETFSFDFGRSNKIQGDFVELGPLFSGKKNIMEESFRVKDIDEDQLLQYLRLNIDPDNQDHFIGLIYGTPYSSAVYQANIVRNQGMLITGGFLLAGIVLSLFFCRRIVDPLKKLTEAAKNIAKGYYDVKLEHKGNDEIGLLSKAFISMIDGIRNREQSIKEKEERYSSIFNSAQEGIVITDHMGVIEEANPAMTKIFGYAKNELVGKSFDLLLAKNSIDPEKGGIGFIEDQYKEEVKAKNREGREMQIYLSINKLLFSDGQYFSSVIHDLTEQYAARKERARLQSQLQQAQKMEAIGQVSSGLAHDFNNVLNSIIGYTSLAKEAVVIGDLGNVEEYLDIVSNAAQGSSDITRQLLVFSREKDVELKAVDVAEVVGSTVKMVASMLPSSIIINHSCQYGLPHALMNANQLQQVILNLCINARDAIIANNKSHGEINIVARYLQQIDEYCSSCHEEFNGNYVEVAIGDNGIGMSEQTIQRIFEPFYSTKESNKGTGMGLAMVHGSIHTAEGHIIVDSTELEGTTFRLFFKVV